MLFHSPDEEEHWKHQGKGVKKRYKMFKRKPVTHNRLERKYFSRFDVMFCIIVLLNEHNIYNRRESEKITESAELINNMTFVQ